MKIASNDINGIVVKRQIHETIEPPTQYEMPEGLPFYYYFDLNTAFLFIGLGILAFFASLIGSGLFYYFLIFKRKYRCKRCGHSFYDKKDKEQPICPKCGAECINA
ncbi:hypothetical protein IJ472_04780 [bacterium]|nr:hypothetical protein [bacterium]